MSDMTQSPIALRVASYNIRKAVGLDRQRSPDRITGVIAGLEADLVAVQEADRRLGERPAVLERERIAEETGLAPAPVAVNAVSMGWHGNAVLVAPDIEVMAVRRIALPGLEPRGAVALELARRGRRFRAVATHLGLTRRHRRRQLARITEVLRAAGGGMPTVVLGDMNEWSAERGLEPLEAEFAVHAPGRSFHAARPVAALDRIAVSRDVGLTGAGVAETPASRIASDHLPVWADIELAGPG